MLPKLARSNLANVAPWLTALALASAGTCQLVVGPWTLPPGTSFGVGNWAGTTASGAAGNTLDLRAESSTTMNFFVASTSTSAVRGFTNITIGPQPRLVRFICNLSGRLDSTDASCTAGILARVFLAGAQITACSEVPPNRAGVVATNIVRETTVTRCLAPGVYRVVGTLSANTSTGAGIFFRGAASDVLTTPVLAPDRRLRIKIIDDGPVSLGNPWAGFMAPCENVTASAGGTVISGQDGWYVPVVAGSTSVDQSAFTYAGNALGIAANPVGANQFFGGIGPGSTVHPRAQRDVNFACGNGRFTAGCDIAVRWNGTSPAVNDAGSFSVGSVAGGTFIQLARWSNSTPTHWNADFVHYDAAGAQVIEQMPDARFQNLMLNHWYHWQTRFDLQTNKVVEIQLIDLATDDLFSYSPVDWYLLGGAPGGLVPTYVRLYVGGTTAGNVCGFDNVSTWPEQFNTAFSCTNPAGSLTVLRGELVPGSTITLGVNNPLGTQNPGSLPLLAFSFTRNPAECGLPLPGYGMAGGGAPGELLIGNSVATMVGSPWLGPSSPVPFSISMPVGCAYIGLPLFAQGAMLDLTGPVQVGLTQAIGMMVTN